MSIMSAEHSGKWAEVMLAKIKITYTQTALDALKAAIAKQADAVHDRRLIEILEKHIGWKERDFRALEIGARRARARLDETLVAQGLRPARSHE